MQYYILIKPSAVYVKEAAFFRSQNGHKETWGKGWQLVDADSIEHARTKGELLREQRRNSHE